VLSTVTGYADERIGFVEQRVMTNAKLLEIIDKFKLFQEERGSTPESVLIEKFRKHIFLERIQDPSVSRGRSQTVAFSLAVEDGDPKVAAAIANDLVTMFLQENVKTRTARASETTQFLAREADRLSRQVSLMDTKVADFKQKHSDVLPEHLELRINMLQRAEADLNALKQKESALEQETHFLEAQRTSLGAILSASDPSDRSRLSPAELLAVLRAELIDKSSVYGAAHPDMRNLRRRIASLEREVGSSAQKTGAETSVSASDPAHVELEAQIVSARAQLESIKAQKAELQQRIETLQAQIIETPQVEKDLKDLTRDYESAMAEFENISAKKREAELAENLEEQEKAERFVLLEPPQVPSVPVWPKKPKAYLLGFVLAAGCGAGTALLAEILDNSIRGTAALTSILQRHPLAVIPFIESSADKHRERVRRRWFLFAVILVLIAALAITHFFYQPLDVLVTSLFEAVVPS